MWLSEQQTKQNRTKMIEDSKRPTPRYRGMTHAVKTIVAEEGYRGLYRGVGPVVSLNLKGWRLALMRADLSTRCQFGCPILVLLDTEAIGTRIGSSWLESARLDDFRDRSDRRSYHSL